MNEMYTHRIGEKRRMINKDAAITLTSDVVGERDMELRKMCSAMRTDGARMMPIGE